MDFARMFFLGLSSKVSQTASFWSDLVRAAIHLGISERMEFWRGRRAERELSSLGRAPGCITTPVWAIKRKMPVGEGPYAEIDSHRFSAGTLESVFGRIASAGRTGSPAGGAAGTPG